MPVSAATRYIHLLSDTSPSRTSSLMSSARAAGTSSSNARTPSSRIRRFIGPSPSLILRRRAFGLVGDLARRRHGGLDPPLDLLAGQRRHLESEPLRLLQEGRILHGRIEGAA